MTYKRCAGDAGAGTVMTAGLVAVAVLVAAVSSSFAAVHGAGVRAQGVADTAALAAAALDPPTPDSGCAAAARVVAANPKAVMTSCERRVNTATWVVVQVPLNLPALGDAFTVTRRAHAAVPAAVGLT